MGSDTNVSGATNFRPASYFLPFTVGDWRSEETKNKQLAREEQRMTEVLPEWRPLVPSFGYFVEHKESPIGDDETSLDFYMTYMKLATEFTLWAQGHSLTLMEGYKIAFMNSSELNPDNNVYLGINETKLTYLYNNIRIGRSALGLGLAAENQWRPTGDDFIQLMASLRAPYLRTAIEGGILRHLSADEGKPKPPADQNFFSDWTWYIVQPLIDIRTNRYNLTFLGFFEGEYNNGTGHDDSAMWWLAGGAIAASY
jgi:hypothetical protein